ncbi:MAG: amidase [Armatimonadota bacterium]
MSSYLIEREPLAPIAEGLRGGELDLLTYLGDRLDRLQAVDPEILAVLPEPDRRERLQREAEALLERWPDPAGRPPLWGVPVGVKDIFRVDGFPTRAGSTLPPEFFDRAEAAAVRRLREAGALVLGKTVTTEFAFIEPGPTRNPHAPDHTPGGSSSGSAAAVAAGICPLALGSQTVGSTLRPAAFCGVVGFKPTYGLIPLDGVVPLAPSFDHAGILTQDAAGAALAASVLVDGWSDQPEPSVPARLGIPAGPFLEQASPEGLAAFRLQVEALKRAGWSVEEVPALEEIEAIGARHRRLMAAEAAAGHAGWVREHADRYRPRTLALIREGEQVDPSELPALRESRETLRRELERRMDEAGINLWVCPAASGPAPEGLDFTGAPQMQLPWTHAGLPAISLPGAESGSGLPLGLQLIARSRADRALLRWAEQLEPVLRRG